MIEPPRRPESRRRGGAIIVPRVRGRGLAPGAPGHVLRVDPCARETRTAAPGVVGDPVPAAVQSLPDSRAPSFTGAVSRHVARTVYRRPFGWEQEQKRGGDGSARPKKGSAM